MPTAPEIRFAYVDGVNVLVAEADEERAGEVLVLLPPGPTHMVDNGGGTDADEAAAWVVRA